MARYRRYRRTIVRAPKKKWCSIIKEVEIAVQNATESANSVSDGVTLAENKSETTAPTPVIIKTGNFKFQGDFRIQYPSGSTVSPQNVITAHLYIIYVPEGFGPSFKGDLSFVKSHPEWILAWRVFDINQAPQTLGTAIDGGRIVMSSRLKRNLNTGDKIRSILIGDNFPPGVGIALNGMCQFWTCAN